jgi:hypothetical protein|tara:strand:+ start:160 stop:480 length:321 start_codon:yes stop_codon:yes gene_type:complete
MKKKIKMNTIEDLLQYLLSPKLIAEFMGYEILYRPYSNGFIKLSETELCDVDDLEYHTSWDWLMPVIKKIKLMDVDLETWRMIANPSDYEIEDVHNQVVEFIKCYK